MCSIEHIKWCMENYSNRNRQYMLFSTFCSVFFTLYVKFLINKTGYRALFYSLSIVIHHIFHYIQPEKWIAYLYGKKASVDCLSFGGYISVWSECGQQHTSLDCRHTNILQKYHLFQTSRELSQWYLVYYDNTKMVVERTITIN